MMTMMMMMTMRGRKRPRKEKEISARLHLESKASLTTGRRTNVSNWTEVGNC